MNLPPGKQLKLYLEMDGLQAEEALRNTPGLTPAAVRKLTLAATGSKELAADAYSEAVDREGRAGLR